MSRAQRTKSRAKLYNALSGVKEITGAGGVLAVGSIDFGAVAIPTDTVTIGDYVFEFTLAASEAVGTSAGTAADPHLVAHGANVQATSDNLAAKILEETATTGAWGYLYPDDSVGCVADGTDKVTLTFWPGAWANDVTIVDGCDTAGVVVQPVTASLGVDAPIIDFNVKRNILDTTGSAASAKEYYVLDDGEVTGDTATITVKTFADSETPTVLGHFENGGAARVEMEMVTDEPGVTVELLWTGAVWELTNHSAFATIPVFTASA